MKPFADRNAAGRELANRLLSYAGRSEVLVLGLPRGGVPVAFEVARRLKAPLDVLVVRKLGAPGNPEFALGAIATAGVTIVNEGVPSWLTHTEDFGDQLKHERAELKRREHAYRHGLAPLSVKNRTVILVDDGAATGASMLVAVQACRKLGAQRVVVALPVASAGTCAMLRAAADDVVCVGTPEPFYAVGEWYQDFSQTTDEDVIGLLATATEGAAAQSPPNHPVDTPNRADSNRGL